MAYIIAPIVLLQSLTFDSSAIASFAIEVKIK